MDDIQLRRAGADDVQKLLTLIHAAFAEYQGRLEPPSGAHAETGYTLQRYLLREHALIAERDATPVGYLFFVADDAYLYVHRLAVPPAHRRAGIGRTLMDAVEHEALALALPAVHVAVRTAFLNNKLFYEALGYRVVGVGKHPGFDVYTFFHMEKDLTVAGAPSKDMRTIQVVPYNPSWPRQYETEAARLRPAFGHELVSMHHIGSTAIAGIHAKPIIDILPVVRDITRVDRRNPWLVTLGYDLRGENGIPGRRYFSKGGPDARTHHVHVFQAGHPEIDRHVNFCAYLNAHPADAQRYALLKQELAVRFPHDILGYNDGKSALIRELDTKAAAWARSRN